MVKTIIQIILAVIVLYLGYRVYESIMEPVRFNNKKAVIEKAVIKSLEDIRDAQVIHKNLTGHYMGSFDTLVDFINTAKIDIIKVEADPNDTTYTKSIEKVIGQQTVYEKLFGERKDYKIDNFRYIPFSDGKEFGLDADQVIRGGVEVSVFEAKAHFDDILKGMNKDIIFNEVDRLTQKDQYPGIKVGSMEDPSTDGNWK